MSRRLELAAMESIGMTKKQARNMLVLEGVGYASITLMLAGVFGNLIAINLFRLIQKSVADQFVFNYPYALFLTVAVIIISICVITPMITYRAVNKSTVTERLREME